MSITMDIQLKRVDKIYREGDMVSGVVMIQSKDNFSHQGISLAMDGQVSLQLSAKSVGLFEAFYNSLKPIQLVSFGLELAPPGKMTKGQIEIPFEIPLKPKPGQATYETYHGVFVNIQYVLRCEMKRGAFSKAINKSIEFIVEASKTNESGKQVDFTISPASLENLKDRAAVPDFSVEGKLHTSVCSITKPFTGEITLLKSEAPIKSIELQLVRVETCGCLEGYAKDATEIQNIQIAEGDVCRNLSIPLYMIFPRLFTCPTLATDNFKVEFEVNVVIVLATGDLITENFPIKLIRN
eukprot:m.24781 g.24781  ORF g.24781 m.24781 type:complete len:296 (-) comp4188_c0_seq1:77-964(-)